MFLILLCFSLIVFTSPLLANESEVVIVNLSNTSQGNGFNWPSTIGWLSEVFLLRAEEGQALEEKAQSPKIKVLYDLQMAGSSSASASTILLASLTSNKNLGLSNRSDGLYTVDDLFTLGYSLRFLAMSLDFDSKERRPFIKIGNEHKKSNSWWAGKYEHELILETFGSRIYLANQMRKRDLYKTVPKNIISAKQRSIKPIIDIPYFERWVNIPKLKNKPKVYDKYKNLVDKKNNLVNDIKNDYLEDINKKEIFSYLAQTELPAGFMTTTYALWDYGYSNHLPFNIQNPPAFSNLRPVIFCNQKTAQLIISSPHYQEAVKYSDHFVNDFVIAVVDNLYDALIPSLYEPGLQEFLYGNCKNKFNIIKFYDPKLDKQHNYKEKFTLFKPENVYLALAGGFTLDSTSSWMLNYYLLSKEEQLKNKYSDPHLLSYIGRFGKKGKTSKFHRQVIKDYFYSNPNGTEPKNKVKNLERYYDLIYYYHDNYHKYFDSIFENSLNYYEFDRISYNWDYIGKIPSAVQGKSVDHLLKSINHTRGGYQLHLPFQSDFLKNMVYNKRYAEYYLKTYGRYKNTLGYTFDFNEQRDYGN